MHKPTGLNRASLLIAPMLIIGFLIIGSHKGGVYVFGLAQSPHRTVDERADPREPIQVLGIKKGANSVNLSEDFDNGDDWLKGVSLKVKNKSDKTIVYFETDLAFFETQASGNVMLFSLRYGRRPWRADDGIKSPFRLEPGAIADLPITDDTYNSLKRFLSQRHSISSLHKATLRPSMVIFDDGLAWGSGSFRCPDPNRPGKYYSIDGDKCP